MAGLVGMWWGWRRIRIAGEVVDKFFAMKPVLGSTSKRVHKFWDEEEGEVRGEWVRDKHEGGGAHSRHGCIPTSTRFFFSRSLLYLSSCPPFDTMPPSDRHIVGFPRIRY